MKGFLLITLVCAVAYYSYLHVSQNFKAPLPDESNFKEQEVFTGTYPQPATNEPDLLPKQRHVNGSIILSRQEASQLSDIIKQKYIEQDHSPILLSDGTEIPLKFTPNGKINPHTGRPEGNITIDAKIEVER